jgi:hypothetical protein
MMDIRQHMRIKRNQYPVSGLQKAMAGQMQRQQQLKEPAIGRENQGLAPYHRPLLSGGNGAYSVFAAWLASDRKKRKKNGFSSHLGIDICEGNW